MTAYVPLLPLGFPQLITLPEFIGCVLIAVLYAWFMDRRDKKNSRQNKGD